MFEGCIWYSRKEKATSHEKKQAEPCYNSKRWKIKAQVHNNGNNPLTLAVKVHNDTHAHKSAVLVCNIWFYQLYDCNYLWKDTCTDTLSLVLSLSCSLTLSIIQIYTIIYMKTVDSLFWRAAHKLVEPCILSEILRARASGRRRMTEGIRKESQSSGGEEGRHTVEERAEVKRVKEK